MARLTAEQLDELGKPTPFDLEDGALLLSREVFASLLAMARRCLALEEERRKLGDAWRNRGVCWSARDPWRETLDAIERDTREEAKP